MFFRTTKPVQFKAGCSARAPDFMGYSLGSLITPGQLACRNADIARRLKNRTSIGVETQPPLVVRSRDAEMNTSIWFLGAASAFAARGLVRIETEFSELRGPVRVGIPQSLDIDAPRETGSAKTRALRIGPSAFVSQDQILSIIPTSNLPTLHWFCAPSRRTANFTTTNGALE
jgi:hypothetical protein